MLEDYPKYLVSMCTNHSGEVQVNTALQDKGNSTSGTAISSQISKHSSHKVDSVLGKQKGNKNKGK